MTPLFASQLGIRLTKTRNGLTLERKPCTQFANANLFRMRPSMKLMGTGNLKLFEATTNSVWGTASSLKSKETKEGTGTGENVFGKILEKLRQEFKES